MAAGTPDLTVGAAPVVDGGAVTLKPRSGAVWVRGEP
jgi:hypothetical protein